MRQPRRLRTCILGTALAALASSAGCQCSQAPPSPAVDVKAANESTTGAAPDPAAPAPFVRDTFTRNGLAIEFALVPATNLDRGPRAGDDVAFRFTITAVATGTPVRGGRPAAWVSARAADESPDPPGLAKRIAALLQGDRLAPPELDLNQFYVLALNEDATITIVDPRFGFGGTRLLAMVTLPGPGADWVLSPDGRRLFVSVPSVGRVVAIDTVTWTITGAVTGLDRPGRLALQADGHDLWVACDGQRSGVAAIVAAEMTLAAEIATGAGPHDLALDRDDLHVFVTNRDDGTVSVIDARARALLADVATGPAPTAVACVPAAGSAYVLDGETGEVAALAGSPPSVLARIPVGPGSSGIRVVPGGRLVAVTNPAQTELAFLDSAVNRVIQRVEVEGGPDQVAFSERFAYARQSSGPMVRLVPLDGLPAEGRAATAIDVPGGRNPFSQRSRDVLAAAIAEAPGDSAMLIANPGDRAIYYYREGMSAPLGSFRNYSREPLAVLAVDRSLREVRPGVFETAARLRRTGRFEVAFLLDSPRIIHAFDLDIPGDPDQPPAPAEVEVKLLGPEGELKPDQPSRLRVKLSERPGVAPVADRDDVRVLAVLFGRWQHFETAVATDEPGVYEFEFRPPWPGLYTFYIECASAHLSFRNPWIATREVPEP